MYESLANARIILIGVLLLLIVLPVSATALDEPPEGVAAFPTGGYATADYPETFASYDDDGLTIEMWLYLTDLPARPGEGRNVFFQPGIYSATIRRQGGPQGVVVMEFNTNFRNGNMSSSHGLAPEKNLNRWIHVAYQIKADGDAEVSYSYFWDGKIRHREITDRRFPSSDKPLYFRGGGGWIDAVRISDIWRYNADNIDPPREFRKDRHTLALWHFNEGLWARQYLDSSGNDYTLYVHGPFPVEGSGKIPELWGRLKAK